MSVTDEGDAAYDRHLIRLADQLQDYRDRAFGSDEDAEGAVVLAANGAHDADTVAARTGALSGA